MAWASQVTPQLALASRVGSELMLRTALIVREDDLSLYGFAEVEELQVFDLLRGVTGVGPKSALGVCSPRCRRPRCLRPLRSTTMLPSGR